MKKTFVIISLMLTTGVHAANWWERDTICKINPSKCYQGMGAGYDAELWDSTSKCWGLKVICSDALTDTIDGKNAEKTKKEISNRVGINPDYDTSILNGDCFGVRKTIANGTQAYYNNQVVNVYCDGILEEVIGNDTIENVANGSILTRQNQPTCAEMAEYGYVTVKNGNCYGKQYQDTEYYIGCNGDDAYLVVLNGADRNDFASDAPRTRDAANKIFKRMIETAETNRAKR